MSEPSTIAPPVAHRSRLIPALKLVALLIVLACVGYALVKQLRQVHWDEVHFQFLPAVGAVLSMLAVSAMQLVMFRSLLFAYGYRLPWRVTLGAAWVPPLGKYVPGKVASIAGAVYLQRKYGVPGAVAVSVALMLDGLAVIAGLVMSTPLLLWEPVRQRMPTAWAWCSVLVILGFVAIHPRIFTGLLNILLKKLKRSPLQQVPSVARYVLPVAAAFGQWIFAGIGLWLMTRSVTEVSPSLLPLFIATAALAMTLSYLALFAPGGLGVREGLYLIVLGPVFKEKIAVVIVAMRVLQTLIELTLATIGMITLRAVTPSPTYSGERAGERGKLPAKIGCDDSEIARPSPLPSPRSTEERE